MQRALLFSDEAHAAHVGSQLEDRVHAFGGFKAVVAQLEIEDAAVSGWMALVPLGKWLDVDRAN